MTKRELMAATGLTRARIDQLQSTMDAGADYVVELHGGRALTRYTESGVNKVLSRNREKTGRPRLSPPKPKRPRGRPKKRPEVLPANKSQSVASP